jgi:hypothetical protein
MVSYHSSGAPVYCVRPGATGVTRVAFPVNDGVMGPRSGEAEYGL